MTDAARRRLAVVLHDVAPATEAACRRLLQDVRSLTAGPVTLLVVPRYQQRDLGEHPVPPDPVAEAAHARWLDAAVARGDELALHGDTHRDEGQPGGLVDRLRRRWYTAGEGEFAALSHDEASLRMHRGIHWFAHHGWPLHGFVAPAWLMSPGTWQALAGSPFAWTCTADRLVALRGVGGGSGAAWPAPDAGIRSRALVYSTRARWRRIVSRGVTATLARLQHEQPLLRLELHPPDVLHEPIRAHWMALLAAALQDREPVTLGQALQ